jgi:hypothetical protein
MYPPNGGILGMAVFACGLVAWACCLLGGCLCGRVVCMRKRVARKVILGATQRGRQYRHKTVHRALISLLGGPCHRLLPRDSVTVCQLILYWPEVEAFALEGENVLSS